jgi:putative transposase
MSKRLALTDEHWDRAKEMVPGKDADPGRSGSNNRLFIDAVLYVLKTGVPWRDLRERFGNWNSVWHRFDRWGENGIWEKIVKALSELDLEELQLDSTSIKVQLAAIGGRRKIDEKRVCRSSPRSWPLSRRPEYQGPRCSGRSGTPCSDAPESGTGW